jgi:hypothetical protein
MQKRIVMWFASLIAVAGLTSAAMFAQTKLSGRDYKILSGADIGFRVEGTDMSGKPTGTFMVRIDGRWVEISAGPVLRRTK